jgi:hypothetical protein
MDPDVAVSLLTSLIGVVLGTITGGIITWWVAKRYYEKASQELGEETQKLRHMLNTLARALEVGEAIVFVPGESGDIQALRRQRAVGGTQSAPSGDLAWERVRPKPDQGDE